MIESSHGQVWASGAAYEPFVGRWSRLVAREFLKWLDVSANKTWLDVGCGTGAQSQTILQFASPERVTGVDKSDEFIAYVREQIKNSRANFETADAQDLHFADATFDAVVSGLMLNFVPDANRAAAQMARVTKTNGVVGAYVWDYAGEMQLLRYFWDAVCELDPAACDLDEGKRFPICQPEALAQLFRSAALREVATRAIDVLTVFRDFDDYWLPFLGGQGPASSYVMGLSKDRRVALREKIRARLPLRPDGSIHLTARAWAVKGIRN